MKKAILYSIFLLGFLILSILPSIGQITSSEEISSTNFSLNREISLVNASEIIEVKVKCKQNQKRFNIDILTTVYRNNLKIEIFNPLKKKIDSFDVEGIQVNDENIQGFQIKDGKPTGINGYTVTGEIHKIFENPIQGDWIVKIIPEEVNGKIIIKSSNNYETK